MPSYNTEVISLRLQPFREADGLALLLTREQGQVTALCQGIRKMRSSLASAAQPGTYSLATLAKGRRWDILTQAEVKDYFPEIRSALARLSAALYLLDLLAGGSAHGQRQDRLFDFSLEALRSLKSHPDPLAIVTSFELHLLDIYGTPLVLDSCALCGAKVPEVEWMVSVKGGGRICPRCKESARPVSRLTTEAGEYLLAAQVASPGAPPEMLPRRRGEVRGFLSRFVSYHLGNEFRSREFMNSVLLARNREV